MFGWFDLILSKEIYIIFGAQHNSQLQAFGIQLQSDSSGIYEGMPHSFSCFQNHLKPELKSFRGVYAFVIYFFSENVNYGLRSTYILMALSEKDAMYNSKLLNIFNLSI